MTNIIKKSVEVTKPVVVGKKSEKEKTSRAGKSKSDELHNPLAFSERIDSEIQRWKEKITGKYNEQAESQKQHHANEIEEAYQKGYDKGTADGIEQMADKIEQERAGRIKGVDSLLKEAKKKSNEVVRNTEIKIIELAVAIADQKTTDSAESHSHHQADGEDVENAAHGQFMANQEKQDNNNGQNYAAQQHQAPFPNGKYGKRPSPEVLIIQHDEEQPSTDDTGYQTV